MTLAAQDGFALLPHARVDDLGETGRAADCTAWNTADPRAVDAFAVADTRSWRERASQRPDLSWLQAMVDATRQWAEHRGL